MAKKKYQTIFGETDKDGNYTYFVEPKTKQSFKDQCDINRVLDKAKRTGVLAHVNKHNAFYGEDMADFDYEAAQIEIARTNSVFYELDAEVRREFGNDPGAFRTFVSQNGVDQVIEKFPQLAQPGRQLPDVVGVVAPGAPVETGGTPTPEPVVEEPQP